MARPMARRQRTPRLRAPEDLAVLQRARKRARWLAPPGRTENLAALQRPRERVQPPAPPERAGDSTALQRRRAPAPEKALAHPLLQEAVPQEFRLPAQQTSAPGRSKHRCRGARR